MFGWITSRITALLTPPALAWAFFEGNGAPGIVTGGGGTGSSGGSGAGGQSSGGAGSSGEGASGTGSGSGSGTSGGQTDSTAETMIPKARFDQVNSEYQRLKLAITA